MLKNCVAVLVVLTCLFGYLSGAPVDQAGSYNNTGYVYKKPAIGFSEEPRRGALNSGYKNMASQPWNYPGVYRNPAIRFPEQPPLPAVVDFTPAIVLSRPDVDPTLLAIDPKLLKTLLGLYKSRSLREFDKDCKRIVTETELVVPEKLCAKIEALTKEQVRQLLRWLN